MLSISQSDHIKRISTEPVDNDGRRRGDDPERFVVDVDEDAVVGVPHVHGTILTGGDNVRTARSDAT